MTFTRTQCDLVKFHGGNFQNSGIVDGGFKRAIQRLNDYAEVCKVKVGLLWQLFSKCLERNTTQSILAHNSP